MVKPTLPMFLGPGLSHPRRAATSSLLPAAAWRATPAGGPGGPGGRAPGGARRLPAQLRVSSRARPAAAPGRALQRQNRLPAAPGDEAAGHSNRRVSPPRAGRRHLGKVTVPQSNRRRAADITSLPVESGGKLRLAVVLNCADRMILAWRLLARILAEDVAERVREPLPLRFGADRRRALGLKFLTDNGPEFAADLLRELLSRLGLVACHTPRRSPFVQRRRRCVLRQLQARLPRLPRVADGYPRRHARAGLDGARQHRRPAQHTRHALTR